MKKLFLVMFLQMLEGCSTIANGLTLNPSIELKGVDTVMTAQQKNSSTLALDLIEKNTGNDEKGSLLGITDLGANDLWYEFYTNLTLYGINSSNREYLGSWELLPFDEHLFLAGEYSASAERSAGIRGVDFNRSADNLAVANEREVYYFADHPSNLPSTFGCLYEIPMRYGDINNDNSKELILYLGENIIFFSTLSNQVIFSYHYWLDDELTLGQSQSLSLARYPLGINITNEPQYIASSGIVDNLVQATYPAQRSYTKLYISEFQKAGTQDIVLWRKLYKSKNKSDTVNGFSLTGNKYIHYIDDNGIYTLADTEEETIQQWLASANLTWQKGYPNNTECEGQTGHIPEMIDPLLNDPDVLQ